jgi:hypothetical protein
MSMRGARRQRREQDAELEGRMAAALADVPCSRCGRVFEGQAAHTIGHEHGRCLPDGAYGQLVKLRDGRWGQRWKHPEIT